MPASRELVHYRVAIDPQRHELAVEVHLAGEFASGDELLLETPTWVPGDYNFAQYARDIFAVEATDTRTGRPLRVTRAGWQGFCVHEPTGDIHVAYRAYAFEPDFGEASGILDNTFAVLMGNRYLYSRQHLGACRVRYEIPEPWVQDIHHPSGARRIDDTTWEYPSYEILLDTPVVIGQFDKIERSVGGTPIYSVFVDRGVGFDDEVERFVDDLEKVAVYFHEMYGSFPFEDYSFVMSLNPQNEWGLEHLTSTMCGLGPDVFADETTYQQGVRVCAHELFHAWNVRRLRSAPLLQLQHQLEEGSFTEGLWVAEGFTRYYEFLTCTATGVYTAEEFFSNVVGYYEHLVIRPAYERVSSIDSSLTTYLNHNPKYPGRVNNCVDYYDKGMVIAFGVDASLRLSDEGTDLNRAFSEFYRRFVKWPIDGSDYAGYTTADVLEFFDRILPGLGERLDREVNHPGGLDTVDLLRRLGFEVELSEVPYLGIVVNGDDVTTVFDLLDDSPAGRSGLAPQDVITHVNGFQLTAAALRWAASHRHPVKLDVTRGHRALSFTIEPGSRTAIQKLVWKGDEDQRQRMIDWLGKFDMQPGDRVSLDIYENFHGIETVY